jgi:hypothetical protein
VHYLIQTHYVPHRRALRRCHARDLLSQIKNYCQYYGKPMELRPDYLDRVVKSYFTALGSSDSVPAASSRVPNDGKRPDGVSASASRKSVPASS